MSGKRLSFFPPVSIGMAVVAIISFAMNERGLPSDITKKKSKRDIEKGYPKEQFVAKLRRMANCIEQSRRFRIQVAGERISIPPDAVINIEHERGMSGEEVEFQIKWPLRRIS